jgi:cellulase
MHTSALLLGAVALLLDTASAHGFVKAVNVGGTSTKGSDPAWFYQSVGNRVASAGWDSLNQDLGFVEPNSAGTADVNCHKSATPGKLYANANPGDTIEFEWNTWPDSHKGPIIHYIAPCNGTKNKHSLLLPPPCNLEQQKSKRLILLIVQVNAAP